MACCSSICHCHIHGNLDMWCVEHFLCLDQIIQCQICSWCIALHVTVGTVAHDSCLFVIIIWQKRWVIITINFGGVWSTKSSASIFICYFNFITNRPHLSCSLLVWLPLLVTLVFLSIKKISFCKLFAKIHPMPAPVPSGGVLCWPFMHALQIVLVWSWGTLGICPSFAKVRWYPACSTSYL